MDWRLRLLCQAFVDSTTMRGFAKLWRARNCTLRLLWSLYITVMLVTLATSSYFLIVEYTHMYTTVQEGLVVQDDSEFPSLTVCSLRPLGSQAAGLWHNGSAMSPEQLSRRLRQAVLLAVRSRQSGAARDLFHSDRISTYFQNVPLRLLPRLGVQQEDTILFCLMRHSRNNNPSVSHDERCHMSVRRLWHSQYGNCFDIAVQPSRQVSSVSLVLQAGELRRSHVQDVFSQAAGLLLTLHEPGTHPAIDSSGVTLSLGRATNVKYRHVRHRRLDLGTDASECSRPEALSDLRPVDFGDSFNYTRAACASEHIGSVILATCGCVSAHHLVAKLPNDSHPFCHRHDSRLAERVACVRGVDVPQLLQSLRRCPHRCDFSEYQLSVSSAVWEPAAWQLRFAIDISAELDSVDLADDADSRPEPGDGLREFLDHRHSDNFSTSLSFDRLAMLTVSRLSYDTVSKVEAQQVTLSALLSRIGGIGSLTIGCTLAVFFELFEFSFLFCRLLDERRRRRQREAADKAEVPLAAPAPAAGANGVEY